MIGAGHFWGEDGFNALWCEVADQSVVEDHGGVRDAGERTPRRYGGRAGPSAAASDASQRATR